MNSFLIIAFALLVESLSPTQSVRVDAYWSGLRTECYSLSVDRADIVVFSAEGDSLFVLERIEDKSTAFLLNIGEESLYLDMRKSYRSWVRGEDILLESWQAINDNENLSHALSCGILNIKNFTLIDDEFMSFTEIEKVAIAGIPSLSLVLSGVREDD